jgi:hypothetical protein
LGQALFVDKNHVFGWANHDIILAWDTLENGNLDVDQILAPNIRRKSLHTATWQSQSTQVRWGEEEPALSIQNVWLMVFNILFPMTLTETA